jgi:AcrR family transcriptional regulator
MPSRPPRRPRADGARTRRAILRAAAALATVDGLEGLSIGNLAAAIGMSKSGLYAHFGSKQELQLATIEEAAGIFQAEVVQPALVAQPGVAQLRTLCGAFFDHLQRRTFPGGCFFAGAALEMGTRPGPVKERVAAFQAGFVALIRGFAATALDRGELPESEDPDQLAFELNGIILATDASFVMRDDPAVLDLARQIVLRRLGDPSRAGTGQCGSAGLSDLREGTLVGETGPLPLPTTAGDGHDGASDPNTAEAHDARRAVRNDGVRVDVG